MGGCSGCHISTASRDIGVQCTMWLREYICSSQVCCVIYGFHAWCISRPSIPEARTLVFLDMHHAVVHPLLKASVETRHGSKPRTSFWMGLGGIMKFRWTVPGNRKGTWLICRCHPSVTRCLVIVCGLLSIRSSHLQSDNRKKKGISSKQLIQITHPKGSTGGDSTQARVPCPRTRSKHTSLINSFRQVLISAPCDG